MIAALLALALGAGGTPQQPEITAGVDRTKVQRGDTVTLTIHVAATGNDPVRIADPELSGLELVDAREVSRVQMVDEVAQRVTERVLRLRAVRVGEATIGADVNIGAGTITCNFDGKNKFPTEIGEGTFIGSDTMLVAPVKIGKHAKTGAGSVVTRDVGDDELVYGVPARPKKKRD